MILQILVDHTCLHGFGGDLEFVQPEERDFRYSVRRGHLRASHRGERGGEVPRKRIAVSRGRGGVEIADRAATMRKAITVLALIAFACNISRDVLVHGEPARKPEAAGRNDGYEYQVTARSILFGPITTALRTNLRQHGIS